MNTIRRVFISHTSEFTKFPEKRSFIDAAVAGVVRVGHVPCDMGYFTARDEKPAEYCRDRVRECDVYVGVIGLRYGTPVRDRPEVSYTELEFEAASEAPAKTRLIFVLDPEAEVKVGLFSDNQYGDRQAKFRKRISDSGVICRPFRNVDELEKLIYQALIESDGSKIDAAEPVRVDWPKDKSPYPGLLSFDQEYATLFFGRDREVAEVIAKMCDPGGRFLIVSGASGSGKSSVVGAGVWHALICQDRIPGSRVWGWLRIQPGDGITPFEPLAWGLKQVFPRVTRRPQDLANELIAKKTTVAKLLGSQLSQEQELVLFIDQLEELYTQPFEDKDIRSFLEELIATTRDNNSRLRVVTTVRSEFIARLEELESVLEVLNAGYNYHLGLVLPRALQDMIEKPAQATGYYFEPGLVEDILRETAEEAGALPLVAYALKQLFDRRRERAFTRDAYKEIRGVAGAIGTQADQVVSGLDAEALGAFDRVVAELVHIERNRPPTRKRATLTVFKADGGANKLISALAGQECRVLVTGGDMREPSVQVAHEKLFSAWPRLKEWIDKSGGALQLIDYASEAARRWQDGGDNPRELWPATGAVEVVNALRQFGKRTSPALDRFLKPQSVLEKQLEQDSLPHDRRALIGRILADYGDYRPGVGIREDGFPDIVWVDIERGSVKLEDVEKNFDVKAFRIAKYSVTSLQFQTFINAEDGYRKADWWKGIMQSETPAEPSWKETNSPRETVSWFEAVAFCKWLTQRTGAKVRLPTEWEWQLAATGGDPGYEYPWPGGWNSNKCNSYESRLNRTSAVGMYPSGATRQGVFDMAGNVWEWCLNKYEQPDTADSLRIDNVEHGRRVIRGGSWFDSKPVVLRPYFRTGGDAGDRGYTIGFRLAQDTE